MRPTTGQVGRLTRQAQRRLNRLNSLAAPLSLPITPELRRQLSYVVIESANLWEQYSVCLYLSSALGARDPHGTRITSSPAPDPTHAIDLAVWAVHPELTGQHRQWDRLEQPDLKNKGVLAKALDSIDATIFDDVDRALSYPTRVLADLPRMRNFYAHKSERASRSAMAIGNHYGITRQLTPHELLLTRPPGPKRALLMEWLADLSAVFGLMPSD
ncbi:MAG TPA: hypothetical protein VHR55_02035 [Candidatus Limnocylindria bacterium]|nr:hypothetical protein [Candidatus Limnocylindria bacterium]